MLFGSRLMAINTQSAFLFLPTLQVNGKGDLPARTPKANMLTKAPKLTAGIPSSPRALERLTSQLAGHREGQHRGLKSQT